jgi:hypothetical protein
MPSDPNFGRTDLFHLFMIDNTFNHQVLRRPIESREFLECSVVVSAEQGSVVDGGGSAFVVFDHMVGLGPGGSDVTAGGGFTRSLQHVSACE